MTTNYRLSFNHTLRWIDCRHSHGEVISGKTVLAYIMCDKKNDPPVVMISNYKPVSELRLVGPREAVYCAIVGAGLIEHPLFCSLVDKFPGFRDAWSDDISRCLYLGFSPDDPLLILFEHSVSDSLITHKPKHKYFWGSVGFVDMQNRPIALAIPAQKLSAR